MMRIGRYEILEQVGRGGAGVVYRARDPQLDRDVAVKLLTQARGAGEVRRKRFLREARALAALEHPNVVRLHDLGEEGGCPFLVLSFVSGNSLQALLDRVGPLPVDRAVEVARALAAALEHAHSRGILHRDLKPDNVLLGPSGEPLLTDFGLVRWIDPSATTSRLSQSGAFLGTPGYWAPEQAEGRQDSIGPATDVYGLGATLYALLTGRPPFQGETLLDYMQALQGPPPAPSSLRPELDRELDDLCLCCLAPDPAKRYESARALGEALRRYAERDYVASRSGRSRVALAGALVTATALGALLYLSAVSGSPDRLGSPAPVSDPPVSSPPTSSPPVSSPSVNEPPEQTRALFEEARDRYERGDFSGALEAYSRVLELDPSRASAWGNRGLTRAALQNPSGALSDYARALELDPRDATTWLNRGVTRDGLGDYPGAIEDFTTAIELDSGAIEAWNGRGNALKKAGQLDAAIRDLTRALELDPGFAVAWTNRGLARATAGDLEAALADCDQAVQLEPESASAWYNRGAVRGRLRDVQGARTDLERAAVLARPGSPLAAQLAEILGKIR